MIAIKIANQQKSIAVDRARIREIVRTVLEGEGVAAAEISVVFADNSTVHQLNLRFLQHDEPTDILTFPLSEPGEKKLAGELIVGAEVAKTEAADRGHDIQAELALYVIHGLLHLCGEDDKTAKAARRMRRRERHYLEKLSLPDIAERD